MDYEKKYKEAHDKVAVRFGTNVAKEIFTDLYEFEDERIWKDVYNYLYNERHNIRQLTPYTDELDRWLAWLEKQKPINISIEDKRIRKSLINYVKAHGNGGDFTKEKYIDWLEKQGERKPVNDTDEDIVEAVKDTSILDMVEPKFHEGDWAVSNLDKKARQISEVHFDEYNSYYVVNGKSVNLEEYDRLHHLWTIQDAKDGDVLVEDSCIFIIQKLGDNSTAAKTYCTLYNYGDFYDGSILYFDIDSTKPATKEQRDTLMKAMADAGWEFDFEKKELKKIEQKPAWSEEDEKHIDSLLERLEGMCKKGATFTKTRFAISQDMDWLKSLKERIGG